MIRGRPFASSSSDDARISKRTWRAVLLGLLLSVLATPAVAWAEPAAEEIERARGLFSEATALEEQEQWGAAADRLQGALAIKETPGLRYHLAYCQEKLGQLVEALANYDRAGELLDSGAQAADVAELLGPARAALAARVPTLDLSVNGNADDAKLSVDDRELVVAELKQPIRLDPGTYQLVVTAPGREPFELTLTLAEGDRKEIRADLERPPSRPAPTPPAASDATRDSSGVSTRTVVLATEASLTLVALSVGIGYAVARSDAADRADEASAKLDQSAPGDASACHSPTAELSASCAKLAEANEDGIDASQMATIGFVGAGIGAVATLATWALWAPERRNQALTIHASPVAGRGFVGVLAGAF